MKKSLKPLSDRVWTYLKANPKSTINDLRVHLGGEYLTGEKAAALQAVLTQMTHAKHLRRTTEVRDTLSKVGGSPAYDKRSMYVYSVALPRAVNWEHAKTLRAAKRKHVTKQHSPTPPKTNGQVVELSGTAHPAVGHWMVAPRIDSQARYDEAAKPAPYMPITFAEEPSLLRRVISRVQAMFA